MKFLFVCVLAASLLARSNSKVEKLYSHKYDTLKIPKTDTMLVVKTHSYKMMNVWKDTVKLQSTDIDSNITLDTIAQVKQVKVAKKVRPKPARVAPVVKKVEVAPVKKTTK